MSRLLIWAAMLVGSGLNWVLIMPRSTPPIIAWAGVAACAIVAVRVLDWYNGRAS